MSENNLSDFLKFAYSKGKIKDINEAFIEYPIEEEIHKGKIENVLHEENNEYNTYSIGDIVFVKQYKYDDGSQGKNHLFVIIEQNNIVVPIENFGMLISSKLEKLKYPSNKLLEKDSENQLSTDSIVKTDVLYKIDIEQILFKVGTVDKEKVNVYKESFDNNQ